MYGRGAVLCACVVATTAALSSPAAAAATTKRAPAEAKQYAVTPPGPPAACYPKDLPMATSHKGQAQIQGPKKFDAASVAVWLAAMKAMRAACTAGLGYNDSVYKIPELEWTKTAFISPQMHPYDRFFFDPSLGNGTDGVGYTVDKWLGDLNSRYGGIDKALIWPTYTNLGIDDRNQFEMIRSMPGGVAGVRHVVEQLHAKGVKVLWPYNPWDSSTKGSQKNNITDIQTMAELLRDTDADGFNGDTMEHIPQAFDDAAAKIHRHIAMEAEGGLKEQDLSFRTIGWAEGWSAGLPDNTTGGWSAPLVDKPKWLTKGKAMTNWCERWSGNPTMNHSAPGSFPSKPSNPRAGLGWIQKNSELQVAFFNALGYESWESVWGTWNGIIQRNGEALRRVGLMLRFFGARGFTYSELWTPYTIDCLQMASGVFASAFPLGHETLYFLVNRANATASGAMLRPAAEALHYYDCYNGRELLMSNNVLSLTIEAHDFGCVLATNNATSEVPTLSAKQLRSGSGAPSPPASLLELLATMRALTAEPLSSFDSQFHYLPMVMVDANASTAMRPRNESAVDEVYVSGTAFHFVAKGVELEGKEKSGVDIQLPWEAHSGRAHDQLVNVGAMFADKFPVTNSKYAAYIKASGYVPSDRANWLKQNFNEAKTAPKPGWENKPVTYVSYEDATAYCAFHKKRLPKLWEWQYLAQGKAGKLLYPWGMKDDPLTCGEPGVASKACHAPVANNDYVNPGPEDVGLYPQGAAPSGVQDLVRSVWQMTSKFEDAHTSSVILRGGSNYSPWRSKSCRWIENDDGTPRTVAPSCYANTSKQSVPGSTPHPRGGSHWYFPPAFALNTYNKYYLMSGSYERAGTVGFRCVADAES